jgi:hypothetical protein
MAESSAIPHRLDSEGPIRRGSEANRGMVFAQIFLPSLGEDDNDSRIDF